MPTKNTPAWKDYLDAHTVTVANVPTPIRTVGREITSLMTPAERQAFLDQETALHSTMLSNNHRDYDWHSEWTMWQAEDIGTRIILYKIAFSSIAPPKGDWTDWGAVPATLPWEIQPLIGGYTSSDMNKSFAALQAGTRDLAAFYDELVTEHSKPKAGAPMTWKEYLAANPSLVSIGDRWTAAMTAAERQQFLTLEAQFYAWNAQHQATTTSAGYNEWIAGTSPGTRLILMAGAHDAGIDNPDSVATTWPAIIQKPKDAYNAQIWFGNTGGGLALFAALRDQIGIRNNHGLSDPDSASKIEHQVVTTPGTGTGATLPGNNLVETHPGGTGTTTTPVPAHPAVSSGGGIGILLLLALAMFAMGKD